MRAQALRNGPFCLWTQDCEKRGFTKSSVTWTMGLRFRPMTSRFEAWNEENIVVNTLDRFTELSDPKTLYFMSYSHFYVFFLSLLDFSLSDSFRPSENPFDDSSSYDEQQERRPRQNQKDDNRRCESRLRVNIPEFNRDTLNPEGFIDWLVVVEEVFKFKEVSENKKVSLIATRLHGRASAWWQQLKLTRESWKAKSHNWRKMKCMRANFIPHNYQWLMYRRLQNLKRGTKFVEDYKTEFYQLIARNDIQEIDDQLVSRYIGGLRVQIMDSINMFDPVILSDSFGKIELSCWTFIFFCHNRS
ncbi:reverse transcriptase domain-containing protein [Artemisia annua]|uniref:Reverse transcriptase domain-containing protein n=1 Tax=Artemisia annua TaxID=35608 RepID=A0A2U1MZX9_ARTAN|nr:reverse transcriptase domain-containing protein [Artemisia annua]